jgi:hypothetical protein
MPEYQYAAVFEPAEEGGYIVTGRSRVSSSFRTSHLHQTAVLTTRRKSASLPGHPPVKRATQSGAASPV